MPNVLVIDDDASLIDMVRQFLDRGGFRVISATSGEEGLRTAVAETPDLVIVDIMMPHMDGYEVCRRLRADPRTARTRILVLTARGQPIDRHMALDAGADDHVTKPFTGKALLQQVQELLDAMPQFETALGCQILVLGLREGIGTTTLASNLGVSLAAEKGCLTVVADMVLPGGKIGDRLGLPPTTSWLEADALGADALAACTVRHKSGLFAMPAPLKQWTGELDPTQIPDLLEQLRGWYDFVVLDAPCHLAGQAQLLLQTSWLVLFMLVPDPELLRTARATLAALHRLSGRRLQVWPVLNMAESEQEDVQQQVEKTLGMPLATVLPYSPQECAKALGDRMPEVMSCPESPLSRRLRALSRQVVQAMDKRIYQGSRA